MRKQPYKLMRTSSGVSARALSGYDLTFTAAQRLLITRCRRSLKSLATSSSVGVFPRTESNAYAWTGVAKDVLVAAAS